MYPPDAGHRYVGKAVSRATTREPGDLPQPRHRLSSGLARWFGLHGRWRSSL